MFRVGEDLKETGRFFVRIERGALALTTVVGVLFDGRRGGMDERRRRIVRLRMMSCQ